MMGAARGGGGPDSLRRSMALCRYNGVMKSPDDYRVEPGSSVKLAKIRTDDDGGMSKAVAEAEFEKLRSRLIDLHELLYAEHKRALLVVLQAMDTGGKDSTIRAIFSGVNPQGCSVTSFKAPSEIERSHDFLWRVHAA